MTRVLGVTGTRARPAPVDLLRRLRLVRDHAAEFIHRQLEKGGIGGLGLQVDDCRKTHAELVAKGVTFLQEPAERPYGVEAVMRDANGSWLVLVEPREFSPIDAD